MFMLPTLPLPASKPPPQLGQYTCFTSGSTIVVDDGSAGVFVGGSAVRVIVVEKTPGVWAGVRVAQQKSSIGARASRPARNQAARLG
jgi:hypothetical protein